MQEGPPKKSPESREGLSKQQVIDRLRGNPEDLSPLHAYLDEREAEVCNSKEGLQLNIEVAEIYRDAGLVEAAKDAFRDAAEQAWQEHEDALYERCSQELDKLG